MRLSPSSLRPEGLPSRPLRPQPITSYLSAGGRSLLSAVARAGGRSEDSVERLLRDAGPIEVYLPVPDHRSRWTGGGDLIVAAQLDEHEAPFGVDLTGRA